MRELNEYKNEIFERSNKRIKQRKKYITRITLSCVPFVVCFMLFSVYILPAMLPSADKMSPEMDYDEMNSSIDVEDGNTNPYTTLTVVYGNQTVMIDEQEKISDVYDYIVTAFEETPKQSNGIVPEYAGTEEKTEDENKTCGNDEVFVVSFTDENKVTRVFEVSGCYVTDNTTAEKTEISQDVYLEIMDLFDSQ